MKKILSIVVIGFLLVLSISCLGARQVATPRTGIVSTLVVGTLTSAPSTTLAPSPTTSRPQPKQEYLVYGNKTVTQSMSNYDADQQNLKLYQYISQDTDIFGYSMDQRATDLLFSDRSLPVFIMNESGGGETSVYQIVAASPTTGKLYARMMQRDQYTSYDDAGSLYELSTDGSNTYRKVFDFDAPYSFILSPDGKKIVYLSGLSLVVRSVDSGDEISRIDLGEFADNWVSSISWAPDSQVILIGIRQGEAHATPRVPYSQTIGCYLVNISDMTKSKLTASIFQTPAELTPGFTTDPFGFVFFPKSARMLGVARNYAQNNGGYLVEFYSVDLNGSDFVEIPISLNDSVWATSISPDEQYLAYPCQQNICVSAMHGSPSEMVGSTISLENGVDRELTLVGWLEK